MEQKTAGEELRHNPARRGISPHQYAASRCPIITIAVTDIFWIATAWRVFHSMVCEILFSLFLILFLSRFAASSADGVAFKNL